MVKDCKCPDGVCAVHWSRKMSQRKQALKVKPIPKPKKPKVEVVEIEDGEF